MPRYSVPVIRTLRTAQYRNVTVEAKHETQARLMALDMADEEEAFWDTAKTHPLEPDEPEIDGFVYLQEDTAS